ncbi:TrmH family RNA methyltransferase [Candidatus Berkelbacteria bacterium]|nr:TrmH family RNA methyltransferase [Candidatus Berkelbacteria bacterium]
MSRQSLNGNSKSLPRNRLVVILDSVRSLYNVGSIFRTADAFGVEHLYLAGLTGAPDDALNRQRIHKTALGAEETVPWTKVDSISTLVERLKDERFTIVALEQTPSAQSLVSFKPTERVALVLGHELYGVNEGALACADQSVQIPMLGQKESLNVSVAFGIACAWLRYLPRRQAGGSVSRQ